MEGLEETLGSANHRLGNPVITSVSGRLAALELYSARENVI